MPTSHSDIQARIFADCTAMLGQLRPEQLPHAYLAVGRMLRRDLETLHGPDGVPAYEPGEIPHGTSTLFGLPVEWTHGDRIALHVSIGSAQQSGGQPDCGPPVTLDTMRIAIAYCGNAGEVRCIVVGDGGKMADARIGDVLTLLPSVTVDEAGRIFRQYFRRDLAVAMRNEAMK